MTDVPPKPSHDSSVRGEGQLLQAMVAHLFHEDNLYWAQIRYLFPLQLAFFAAWYGVGPSWLASVLMFAAALTSWQLWSLAEVVMRNRDVNLDAIKILSSNILTEDSRKAIREVRSGQDDEARGALRFATHSMGTPGDLGRRFQRNAFWICIVLNIILGVLSAYHQLHGDSWLRYLHPRFLGVEGI